LTIPSTVESIGVRAFEHCVLLEDVKIEKGVTELGGSMFSGCTNLTSIEIPSTITVIPSYCFGDCTELETVKLNKGFKGNRPMCFLQLHRIEKNNNSFNRYINILKCIL
jgi:hypothetical protein